MVLAILYCIPWAVGATVQKSPQTDTYMGHSGQTTAPKSKIIQKMAQKWHFFKCVVKWIVLAIIYHEPWVLQCKKVPKLTHIWVTVAKKLLQNPQKSKKMT